MTIKNVLLLAPQGPDGAARRLLERCRAHPVIERWWLTVVDDPQLRIEHALYLNHSDLTLFLVDSDGPASGFQALDLDASPPMPSSEAAVTPADVLHSLATLGRRASLPRCYQFSVRAAGADDDAAFAFLLSLLEEPTVEYWNERLSCGAPVTAP